MRTQLKCDNGKHLVTDKHRQFENLAGKAQVLPYKVGGVMPFTCLLPQLGQIDAFDFDREVSWYLETKQDTGKTHLIQMMPATHSTLHVMLFGNYFLQGDVVQTTLLGMVLVSDFATLQTCLNHL